MTPRTSRASSSSLQACQVGESRLTIPLAPETRLQSASATAGPPMVGSTRRAISPWADQRDARASAIEALAEAWWRRCQAHRCASGRADADERELLLHTLEAAAGGLSRLFGQVGASRPGTLGRGNGRERHEARRRRPAHTARSSHRTPQARQSRSNAGAPSPQQRHGGAHASGRRFSLSSSSSSSVAWSRSKRGNG